MSPRLDAVRSVLVLGGASEIGVAIAAELVAAGADVVVLAGRHAAALEQAGERIRARSIQAAAPASHLAAGALRVETIAFDATEPASHDAVIGRAAELAGGLDVVVIAFGILGDQEADEAGGDGAVRVATTNYVGAVSAGLAVARRLRAQGHGTIVFLSSVAGERVRRANFVYGSSKAGLDGFALGLGDSLAATGVGVLVVRPGWVRGRMTAGRPPAPLATTPESVAAATVAGIATGRRVVWVPAGLRLVFVVFRHLPGWLWRRLPG